MALKDPVNCVKVSKKYFSVDVVNSNNPTIMLTYCLYNIATKGVFVQYQ